MIFRARFISSTIFACLLLAAAAVCTEASTIYHYDDNNRLESIEYDGGIFVVYSYDENGNRCARTSGAGVHSIDVTTGVNGTVSPPSTKAATGGSLTFSIKPDAHYHVAAVQVDGNSVGAVTSYTFNNVTANHSLHAEFAINTYAITASVAGNIGGTISPGSATVTYGGSQTFSLTPASGYHIADVLVDGTSVGAVSSYTFSNVTAGHTIQAAFGPGPYPIATFVVGGTGGTISPNSPTVSHGSSQTFTMTPTTGYHVSDVLVDGISVGAVSTYTFNNVTATHTIQAGFAINTYTIAGSVAGGLHGTIDPTSATVNHGAGRTFTMTPDTGYHVAGVLVDGTSVGTPTSYTFNNVTANHTIQVSFAINTYSVAATVVDGYGGSVSPTSATVNYGGSQTFSITPDATFSIADVRVDGVSQGAVTSYTFSNVTAAHTLKVTFNYSADPVKNQRTGLTYSSLQTAYAAAADGDVLLCRNFRLIESFTANGSISVTIRGGCNADFSAGSGKTILIGAASIRSGNVVWENFFIRGNVFY